ncbi:MAG: immune inhibitor A [Candidatus Latescibacteria bacterium]|nr:immune inhibitor A [Candidatus Latescibacterota bacterium]
MTRAREPRPERRGALLGARVGILLALLLTAGAAMAGRWEPLLPGAERGEVADPSARDPYAQLRLDRRAEVEALTAGLRKALERPQPADENALGDRAAGVGTTRVMVCLLGFRENRRPDLTTVPVDGKFMADADTLASWLTRVDPPPHDAAFFDAHMRAMREFYRIQSYGKLQIEWDILDGPDDGLFLLPDIADYGPGESGGYWTLELLESAVRTMVDSIDVALQADPDGPRFADYDHVMIFHAGSDLQNDIFQDSPNDLPSFNIFFGEPPLVDGGTHPLGSVLLLPETTTQDTDPADPIYGALNAVTAHEFGHQLDLVDTYNTLWGWPSVGYWDLMDSGHQILYGFQTLDDPDPIYVYGALPTSFGIWHRMLLGWVSEDDGSLERPGGGAHDIELTACNVQAPGGVKALRVDFSEREYFLFENRQELLWPGGRYVKSDEATGVFQFVSKDFPAYPDSAENIGEYDLFIPQSGLLAWHVDERDFETLYPLNVINPADDRHVILVEADGAGDLGDPYSFDWRGNDRDPFYTGNVTEWLPEGVPNTRLRDGTASGFSMTDLVTSPYLDSDGFVDSTVTFDIALAGQPTGFPRDDRAVVDSTLAQRPATGSLLPLADGDALWLGYVMDSLDPDTLLQSHLIVSGSDAASGPPLAPRAPARLGNTLSGAALLDAPAVAARDWILLTPDSLLVWNIPSPGAPPTPAGGAELPAGPATLPLAIAVGDSAAVFWLGEDGFLYVLDYSLKRGTPAPSAKRAMLAPASRGARQDLPVMAPLCRVETADGARLGIALGDTLNLVDPFGNAPVAQYPLPDPGDGPFWIRPVDLDADGVESPEELFWVHVDGRVATPDPAGGAPTLRFAAPLGGATLSAEPAVADLDGDGRPELLLAAGDRVHRLSFEGFAYPNWPLRLGELADLDTPMRVGSGLRAADLTGDGVAELIVFGDSGHLIVADADARPVLGTPRSLAAAPPQDLIARDGRVYAVSRDGFLLAFAGSGGAGVPAEWGAGGGGTDRGGRWQRQHALQPGGGDIAEGWLLYPNPAADWVRLHHPSLAAGTHVRLELFDLEGQHKFTREATVPVDGPFEIPLQLRSLASGVYFCRIEVEGEAGSRHLLRRLGVLR